jgi:hypothetical protein
VNALEKRSLELAKWPQEAVRELGRAEITKTEESRFRKSGELAKQ